MFKIFIIRKGVLFLFSEDMVYRKRYFYYYYIYKSYMDFDDRESQLSKSVDEIDLRIVDDLVKFIFFFGVQVKCFFFNFFLYLLFDFYRILCMEIV